ncbi:MAG: U32 family peptidase C-terminal domain-containing protein [Oligoflexia bacterium]|nr:U32 family peptidase C-terminal domain-containing protein [Oligoflexia bacterium]MBF0367018.1 U32 family peptidase C-terminal domain-containing protein [Oligoflexia bacterium]
MQKIPELVLPAGNFEKMKLALLYGASAVYLGGENFGLRTRASNFSLAEIEFAVHLAKEKAAKVYVVINAFLHDQELQQLPDFIRKLQEIAVSAVVVSDVGVLAAIRTHAPKLPIHLSTQASCLNVMAAKFWKELGVKRVVLGREVSISSAAKIKQELDLEVELFAHGSMCVSYSGHCVVSNFTANRDSNRGGCAHSCRFEYAEQAFLLSSDDICGIECIPRFCEQAIDALKIEGRMKNHLYVGTVAKAYREALSAWERGDFAQRLPALKEELKKIPHRRYSSGLLLREEEWDERFYPRARTGTESKDEDHYKIAGLVLEVVQGEFLLIEVRNAFVSGQELSLIPFEGPEFTLATKNIFSLNDERIEKTRPNTLVKLAYCEGVERMNLIRMQV